jgi:hypothetical protein
MVSELSELAPAQLALALDLVFAHLPVKTRLRCAAVCHAWRDAAAERSLWLRLDLREGDREAKVSDRLLRAVARRAGGQLQALDISFSRGLSHGAVLDVVRANADTLRELRMGTTRLRDANSFLNGLGGSIRIVMKISIAEVAVIAEAAPQLRVLETACMHCSSLADAHRLLHREPPFQALQMHTLSVDLPDVAAVYVFIADLPSDPPVRNLLLTGRPLRQPAAMNAVVDAALATRLPGLSLPFNLMFPGSAALLARLLSGTSLSELSFGYGLGADEPAAAVLSDALRANSTLTSLSILGTWRRSDMPRAAAALRTLLCALLAHRSLRILNLTGLARGPAHRAAVGAALGALVAANTAALVELDVSFC